MQIGLALPQYDFSSPEAEPGRLAWAPVEATARRAEAARLPLPLAVRPPLPRPRRYGGPAGRCPGIRPPARPRRPWPGSPTGSAWAPSPSAPPSGRPPSPPSSWPPSTSSPGDALVVGIGAGWNEDEFRVAGVALPPPRRAAAPPGGVRPRAAGDVRRRAVHVRGPLRAGGRGHVPAPAGAAARLRPSGSGARATACSTWSPGWPTGGTRSGSGPPRPTGSGSQVLHAACERAGRDPADGRPLGGPVLPGGRGRGRPGPPVRAPAPADARRPGRGRRSTSGARAGWWARSTRSGTSWTAGPALGVSTVVVSPRPLPFSVPDGDDLEMLAVACRL